MELTAEIFEKTIQAVKGGDATGKAQKRNSPRVGVRCRVRLIVVQNKLAMPPIEAWTRDISRTGIGLSSSQRLEVGSHFAISLARGPDEKPLVLLCTVKACTETSEESFEIGAIIHNQVQASATAPTAPPATNPAAAPVASPPAAAA